jgi:hypothetical protein
MDRRAFLAGTGAVLLVSPLATEPQQQGKVPRIGVFVGSSPETTQPIHGLCQGLRDSALR